VSPSAVLLSSRRSLLVLLYRAGCRMSEALRLLPKDMDRAPGTATVLRGKGGRRRNIGLDPAPSPSWSGGSTCGQSAASAPRPRSSARWRKARPPLTCARLMPRIARRAGIERRCTPTGSATLAAHRRAVRAVPSRHQSEVLSCVRRRDPHAVRVDHCTTEPARGDEEEDGDDRQGHRQAETVAARRSQPEVHREQRHD
jgi:integrase